MIIWQHVHRVEFREFFYFYDALLPVKREIKIKFNFGHSCPKYEIHEQLIDGAFGTLATLPQQTKTLKTTEILVFNGHIHISWSY